MAAMSTATLTARIPIWSPGEFTSLGGKSYSFEPEHLAATASGYSPALFSAPWVKGHPQTDDPAQGWVQSLEWDGKLLWARSERIAPEFAEEVRAGRFAKISPRFFEPDDPSNPMPGTWYLRHVGWLGAAAPANKHLPSPEFALHELQGTATFADGQDPQQVRFHHPAASAMRGNFPFSPTETDPMSEAEKTAAFAEREATISAQEQALADKARALDERESALAQQEQARRLADCASFASTLVAEGRILPRDEAFIAALLAASADDAQVSFAEGDKQITAPTGEKLRGFLSALPAQVDYQERSKATETAEPAASFAAPPGYSLSQAEAERYAKVKAYQKEHNCDLVTAARAVGA